MRRGDKALGSSLVGILIRLIMIGIGDYLGIAIVGPTSEFDMGKLMLHLNRNRNYELLNIILFN